jgi:hypothetical protein
MKKTIRKLVLRYDTLRALSSRETEIVVGGVNSQPPDLRRETAPDCVAAAVVVTSPRS